MKTKLQKMLEPYYREYLDCDGQCNVFKYILKENDVPYVHYTSDVQHLSRYFPYHEWLEVGDLVIDFKARKWLGRTASYGIFEKTNSNVQYLNPIQIRPRVYPKEAIDFLLQTRTTE